MREYGAELVGVEGGVWREAWFRQWEELPPSFTRMIVTLDRGFADIRRYPPGSHSGIVVLRLADESALASRSAVVQPLDNHDLEGTVGLFPD